jgi:hypothetical protein
MADTHHPPLNYEASNTRTNPQSSTTLPPEVSQCLKNARFLHLATIASTTSPTSAPPVPHVSLMNYTFLPTYHHHGPVIIMTTNAQSLKTQNLLSNPNVSILVHDWVSHRPPTTTTLPGSSGDNNARAGSPPAAATRSSLASLLLNLNTSALSSISTTITGQARFLERGSDEEKWCKEMHLANNTFGAGEQGQVGQEAGYFSTRSTTERESRDSESASCYIEGDEVRVVIVPVREGRTADWKGGVKDWVVVEEGNESGVAGGGGIEERGRSNGSMVNGVLS